MDASLQTQWKPTDDHDVTRSALKQGAHVIPEIPDTPTARAAADLAAAAAPAYLLNHSYRTYAFGRCLVADRDLDDEAAFVASMVHDLGLTDAHRGADEFARVGAHLACRFLEQRGWDCERIRLVEQAIVRHTNLVAEQVPVCRLVQAGAAVDVAGPGYEQIPPTDLATILERYPRLDFTTRMRSSFLDEARRHPAGAFAHLERTVALSTRFDTNPIDAITV